MLFQAITNKSDQEQGSKAFTLNEHRAISTELALFANIFGFLWVSVSYSLVLLFCMPFTSSMLFTFSVDVDPLCWLVNGENK